MKVKQLNLPEAHKRVLKNSARCCRLVFHSGIGIGPKPSKRCRRWATFSVQGVTLCTQHAGEMALNHLLIKEGKKNDITAQC